MQGVPGGTLRISATTDFGTSHIAPILGNFLDAYPDVNVNMEFNTQHVELISQGFDMEIRVGELQDSSLRARKICETQRRMIASPSYFERHGRPMRVEDLADHRLLHYSNNTSANVWKLTSADGDPHHIRTDGWLTVNDGPSLLNAAIGGLGIAYLPSFLYATALRDGLVEDVMPDLPPEIEGIYALYPAGRYTQPKVRAFIDFLVASFRKQGPMDW
jgi:DNA-binding transcriptional LysR family regulator